MENLTHYKIHISKLNEVYLKVECDNPGICYELVQYFTFEVPGTSLCLHIEIKCEMAR